MFSLRILSYVSQCKCDVLLVMQNSHEVEGLLVFMSLGLVQLSRNMKTKVTLIDLAGFECPKVYMLFDSRERILNCVDAT